MTPKISYGHIHTLLSMFVGATTTSQMRKKHDVESSAISGTFFGYMSGYFSSSMGSRNLSPVCLAIIPAAAAVSSYATAKLAPEPKKGDEA
jgi:hypothetical protein